MTTLAFWSWITQPPGSHSQALWPTDGFIGGFLPLYSSAISISYNSSWKVVIRCDVRQRQDKKMKHMHLLKWNGVQNNESLKHVLKQKEIQKEVTLKSWKKMILSCWILTWIPLWHLLMQLQKSNTRNKKQTGNAPGT